MDKLNKEKPGTVVLNPPVSMDKVKEFEEKYKITLPKEYVEFITLVGDGGKVQPSPERSAVEITALGGYEESGYPLEGISLQFPLKRDGCRTSVTRLKARRMSMMKIHWKK